MLDISDELVEIIEESWAARSRPAVPHLPEDGLPPRAGGARRASRSSAFRGISAETLFEFQVAAVKIAAHHLNKRGGVLIGDVVGLGKTLMATALARVFEDDHGWETLIICPKNLVPMWEDYGTSYGLRRRR